jgi:hypothetical protein
LKWLRCCLFPLQSRSKQLFDWNHWNAIYSLFNQNVNNFLSEIFNDVLMTFSKKTQTTFWMKWLRCCLFPLQSQSNHLFDRNHWNGVYSLFNQNVNNLLSELYQWCVYYLFKEEICKFLSEIFNDVFTTFSKKMYATFWLKWLRCRLFSLQSRCKQLFEWNI